MDLGWVWWVSWSGFFFGVGGLWGWSTWSKANISQFLGGLRGSLEGRGGSLWGFAPWGRGVKAPYGILPPGIGLERLSMEAPYGILLPGVGLERVPMGFCPLG